ncbi:UNVERIFIED_CONTAM: hypothetical protein Sradi_1727500 [Sesamum radiatum]|uniref:DUF4283 domain-containing protein n=1 Tax=Sesamum radiatum TaxID=300843 RepID=A0AAW2TSK3_SESRA
MLTKTAAAPAMKSSFAGLFSTNRRLSIENKLTKIDMDSNTLKLDTKDLTDVRDKLGHCLVGYIASKFARDEDRQRILAGGPYFVYGRSLILKNMPDCFEFKEDDISVTPVWAILPSLPLEYWHPNALSKIGSRLGTPTAMDSLTMTMERVSYARILVEVDASKKLVDEVEFILPNGVVRQQPIVYEFTPKFCSACNRFGHLKDACQGARPPTATAVTSTATTVKTVAPKEVHDSGWILVQRRHKYHKHVQQQQQHNPPAADSDDQCLQRPLQQQQNITAAGNEEQDQSGTSRQEQFSTDQNHGLIMQTCRAENEELSPAGSSGSSSDSGPSSTTEFIAPIALKCKQKLGGVAPPHPT